MHCKSCALKRKVGKPLLFKQTLRSRFTCLACQHFSFDAQKSLDRERPFSLSLRVVSLFSCLSRLAPSVTRVAICVSHVLLDGLQKKERLLVVYCCCCTSRWSSQYLSNLIRPNLSGSHTFSLTATAEIGPLFSFRLACENIRFSSLFAAGDVSRGGTSATQRQKFHTDDAKPVRNLVRSADWSTE